MLVPTDSRCHNSHPNHTQKRSPQKGDSVGCVMMSFYSMLFPMQ